MVVGLITYHTTLNDIYRHAHNHSGTRPKRLNINMIQELIIHHTCSEFGITKEQLLSPSRRAELVDARQVCAIALREMDFTLKYIAELMGRKDHTTVINLLTTRSHGKPKNERTAMMILNRCKRIDSTENARYKSNLEVFLERVQQI